MKQYQCTKQVKMHFKSGKAMQETEQATYLGDILSKDMNPNLEIRRSKIGSFNGGQETLTSVDQSRMHSQMEDQCLQCSHYVKVGLWT